MMYPSAKKVLALCLSAMPCSLYAVEDLANNSLPKRPAAEVLQNLSFLPLTKENLAIASTIVKNSPDYSKEHVEQALDFLICGLDGNTQQIRAKSFMLLRDYISGEKLNSQGLHPLRVSLTRAYQKSKTAEVRMSTARLLTLVQRIEGESKSMIAVRGSEITTKGLLAEIGHLTYAKKFEYDFCWQVDLRKMHHVEAGSISIWAALDLIADSYDLGWEIERKNHFTLRVNFLEKPKPSMVLEEGLFRIEISNLSILPGIPAAAFFKGAGHVLSLPVLFQEYCIYLDPRIAPNDVWVFTNDDQFKWKDKRIDSDVRLHCHVSTAKGRLRYLIRELKPCHDYSMILRYREWSSRDEPKCVKISFMDTTLSDFVSRETSDIYTRQMIDFENSNNE